MESIKDFLIIFTVIAFTLNMHIFKKKNKIKFYEIYVKLGSKSCTEKYYNMYAYKKR